MLIHSLKKIINLVIGIIFTVIWCDVCEESCADQQITLLNQDMMVKWNVKRKIMMKRDLDHAPYAPLLDIPSIIDTTPAAF